MYEQIGIYTLRVIAPDESIDDENQKIIDNIGEALSHAEDVVNDTLPNGYYCKIDNSTIN